MLHSTDTAELSEGEIGELIDRSAVGDIGDLADDAGAVSRHFGDGIVELRASMSLRTTFMPSRAKRLANARPSRWRRP